MKNKSILAALLFLLSSAAFAQKIKIYYNENWEITTKDSAKYFRLADQYANRIFDGSYEDYYISGQLQASGYYANGKESGSVSWYFKNGNTMCEGYNSSGKFSFDTGYDSLGNIIVENGNGYFTWYNSFNYTKSSEGNYSNGRKKGSWIYYNPYGIKIEEFDHDNDSIINAWDSKGEKLLVKNGNGTYARYYSNGKLKVKGQYVNGKQEGLWTWYHENGDIDCTGNYSKGQKEGVWAYYYDQNKLKEKYRYKNDDREGAYMSWHRNGKQRCLGYYKYNYQTGKWVWFNEDGTVKNKDSYVDFSH